MLKYKRNTIILTLVIVAVAAVVSAVIFSKKIEYVEFTDSRPTRGNLEASVVVTVWSDFKEDICREVYLMMEDVYKEYPDKIKFNYRHLITAKNRDANLAAEASECAQDQGQFWSYYDLLFNNNDHLAMTDLKKYAQGLNIDLEMFNDCLTSHGKSKQVSEDLREASRLGLTSAPSIFVNGELINNWQDLPAAIKALLEPIGAVNNYRNSTSTNADY